MLESRETGIINAYNLDNVYGYYNFSTEDKYKEAIEVFFNNGVSYKDRILLSSIFTSDSSINDVKTVHNLDDPECEYEVIFRATNSAQAEGNFSLGYKKNGNENKYIDINYILDFEGGSNGSINVTVNGTYIDLISSSLIGDRSFKINFKVRTELESESVFKLTTNPGYLWVLEQNKIQPAGSFRPNPGVCDYPVMDCSDYVSFLWALVNNGWIIKGKIFDCQSLLTNRFENIKFVEKIHSNINNSYKKYGSYKVLLENLEIGDILIFNKGNMYHCIIITNPKNESYAECSGYLEQNLGRYYNGKLNPYPLEERYNYLKNNSDVYLCRLYKSN